MGAIYRLSLRQFTSRSRIIIILLLAALPVVISALTAAFGDESDQSGFAEFLLDGMLVAAIMPIVTIAFATAAFGNELEDRTLGYLVLRPVARWQIVLPKLLGVVTVTGPLLVLSGVIAAYIGLDGDLRAAAAVGVALVVGVVTYSTIFTWAGLVTTRALGFALVYVFLWEGLITSFLGGFRYLSVRGYTLTIMHRLDNEALETLGQRAIEFPAAIVGAILMTCLFFLLTVRRLKHMDVP